MMCVFPRCPRNNLPSICWSWLSSYFCHSSGYRYCIRKLEIYVDFLLLKYLHVLKQSTDVLVWVSCVNSKCWHLDMEGTGDEVHHLS